MKEFIYGRNPVYETLRARRRDVFRLQVAEGVQDKGRLTEVLDLAARKTVIATECLCASVSYWNLIGDTLRANRKSRLGGMAHACELETSIYLYFDPDHVHLDKATESIVHDEKSRYFSLDLMGGAKAMVMQWWSAQTADGTMGDPTVAAPGQGKIFFDAAVSELIGLIREMRQMVLKRRVDHH